MRTPRMLEGATPAEQLREDLGGEALFVSSAFYEQLVQELQEAKHLLALAETMNDAIVLGVDDRSPLEEHSWSMRMNALDARIEKVKESKPKTAWAKARQKEELERLYATLNAVRGEDSYYQYLQWERQVAPEGTTSAFGEWAAALKRQVARLETLLSLVVVRTISVPLEPVAV